MGVFRWESNRKRVRIARFPVILRTYMRNRKKITTWSSGPSVKPKRIKSVTDIFLMLMVVLFSSAFFF
jgi:hypothetical protein